MGGKSSIPTSYTLNTNSSLSGGIDLDLDEIRIKELPSINFNGQFAVTQLPGIALDIKSLPAITVNTDNKVDLNSDSKVTLDKVELETDSKVGLTSDSKVALDKIELETHSKVSLDSSSKVDLDSNSAVNLTSDSKVDIGLDNIQIKSLPKIDFQFGFKPMRWSFPLNYRFTLSILGFEIFNFKACGENMVVIEDLEPAKTT